MSNFAAQSGSVVRYRLGFHTGHYQRINNKNK